MLNYRRASSNINSTQLNIIDICINQLASRVDISFNDNVYT
jgi:hypothetical protein